MAGRRLVDAAKLFNASKAVTQKHIALRSNQLDAFNKTSTLAKAVKHQTDRFTLTAAAAIELSKRFSEEAPSYARAAAEQATGTPKQASDTRRKHEDIPRKETVERDSGVVGGEEGLQQDNHYDRSEQNTAVRPPPEAELEIEQEEAPRRPLPDGTIPTGNVTLEQEEKGQDTFSERPIGEAPKEPLVEEKHDPIRQEDEGIKPVESNETTIPLPGKPRGQSTAATESIPSHANDLQQPTASSRLQDLQKGHDRDVFYSRSVESQPAPSSQPRTQIPNHTATKQASDEHVDDKQLNQDVFYQQGTSQPGSAEDVPESVNTEGLFHSTRVAAQMLGSDPYGRKEFARRRGPSTNPFIPAQYQAGHGHDAKVEQPQPKKPESPVQPSQSQTTEKEMQNLASQLAQDAQSNASAAEVCRPMSCTRSMLIS
jgi:aarF domain-containing kinase